MVHYEQDNSRTSKYAVGAGYKKLYMYLEAVMMGTVCTCILYATGIYIYMYSVMDILKYL